MSTPRGAVNVFSMAGDYYFCETINIIGVEELLRPCGTPSARSVRLMGRGRFNSSALSGSPHWVECVIKRSKVAGHGCSLKVETAKYAWLQGRAKKLFPESRNSVPNSVIWGKTVPAVLHWYYSHRVGDLQYMVLEDHYRDIRALLHDTPSDHRWANYRTLQGMLKALKALHSLGMVHGNIAPENIVYRVNANYECVVKFCDLKYAFIPGHSGRTVGQSMLLPVPTDSSYVPYHAFGSAVARQTVPATADIDMFALALVMWQVLQRSLSPLLNVRSEFYGKHNREAATTWIVRTVQSSCHTESCAHFKVFLSAIFRCSCTGRVKQATFDALLRSLSGLEPTNESLVEIRAIRAGVNRVESKVNTIDCKVESINSKLDGVVQTIDGNFRVLNDSVSTYARAVAMYGLRNEAALASMHTAINDAAHDILAATSLLGSTCSDMEAIIRGSMTNIQRALDLHDQQSLQEYADLRVAVRLCCANIESAIQQHDRVTQAEMVQISMNVQNNLNSTLAGIQDVFAAVKKSSAAQEQSYKAISVTLRSLITDEDSVPSFFVLLPELPESLLSIANPMRAVREKFRLYFVCEHTRQIVCGPRHVGYVINNLRDWVVEAAPYAQAVLVLVSIGLLASGIPLPLGHLCHIPDKFRRHAKYLRAAYNHIEEAKKTDAFGLIMHQLESLAVLDEADLKPDHLDKAMGSNLIKMLVESKVIRNLRRTSGVTLVRCAVTGHAAWVRHHPVTIQAWQDAWLERLAGQLDDLVGSLMNCAIAVAKALQYDLMFTTDFSVVSLRIDQLIASASALSGLPPPSDRTGIVRCLRDLCACVELCARSPAPRSVELALECYLARQKSLEGDLESQLTTIECKDGRHLPRATTEAFTALSSGLKCLVDQLTRFMADIACLRKMVAPVAAVCGANDVLAQCVIRMTDRNKERGCPQLLVLLPCIPSDWGGPDKPLLLQKRQCRLFFMCSQSKLLLPCGVNGGGHYITIDTDGVYKLKHLLRVSLIVLTSALERQDCDALPTSFLGAKLNTKELQLKYLYSALDLVTSRRSTTEQSYLLKDVCKSFTTRWNGMDPTRCLDVEKLSGRLDAAYKRLEDLLQLHNLPKERCSEWGMRPSGYLWIADSDLVPP
jgi:hypothetical protein